MSFRNDDTSGETRNAHQGIPTVNPWAARPAEPSAPIAAPAARGTAQQMVQLALGRIRGRDIRRHRRSQAYQELSKPEAWAYWKDHYVSPSMASSEVAKSRSRTVPAAAARALAITRRRSGPAAASWFRDKLDEAKLAPGDTVLLSSPGGNVEPGHRSWARSSVRAALTTAVGTADAAGRDQAVLLRQRLRAGLCRRQGPHRRRGLGAGRSPLCLTQAGRRSRRSGAAHPWRHVLELHDQDGRRRRRSWRRCRATEKIRWLSHQRGRCR